MQSYSPSLGAMDANILVSSSENPATTQSHRSLISSISLSAQVRSWYNMLVSSAENPAPAQLHRSLISSISSIVQVWFWHTDRTDLQPCVNVFLSAAIPCSAQCTECPSQMYHKWVTLKSELVKLRIQVNTYIRMWSTDIPSPSGASVKPSTASSERVHPLMLRERERERERERVFL